MGKRADKGAVNLAWEQNTQGLKNGANNESDRYKMTERRDCINIHGNLHYTLLLVRQARVCTMKEN